MKRKKLIKQRLAEYAGWLDEQPTEVLKAVKVRFGVSVPSFKVTVDAASQKADAGSEGSCQISETARKR